VAIVNFNCLGLFCQINFLGKIKVYKMKLPKYSTGGDKIGEIELDDSVFKVDANRELIYQIIKSEEANKRLGCAATKTRGMVSGGGAKPWRQKGTGRARQGSTRATQWVGGGIPFGPHPRNFSYKIPKKMRQNAIRAILSYKANNGAIRILDKMEVQEPKTKIIAGMLKKLNIKHRVTMLISEENKNFKLAARNIPNLKYLHVSRLSGRELFINKEILASEEAIKMIEKLYKIEK
jgi:large subunit ribosomal protein L4